MRAERFSLGLSVSQAGKFGLIPTAITVGTGAAGLGAVSMGSICSSWLQPAPAGVCRETPRREVAGGLAKEPAPSPLAQVTFLCDMLLLYVDRKGRFYWRTKYEEVGVEPTADVVCYCYLWASASP